MRDIFPFRDWIPLFQAVFVARAYPIMRIDACDRAGPGPGNVAVSPRFDLHLIELLDEMRLCWVLLRCCDGGVCETIESKSPKAMTASLF